ncbi:hypothetical protein GALMADRAFT_215369 [Galerina marginata CBS 339.88]|uniref:DUF6533 domain-containing protein n=1 Tax=Galerina marginata (strain CBS 339.88) TaxID=685588 RepID=A0A067SQK9_GALM3|nr:hypothetical protein GALMADRAFT_215369 [Galerina marginata CBS 339.88]
MSQVTNPAALYEALLEPASNDQSTKFNGNQEVAFKLIWQTKWTLPKALYIFLRYFGPLWLMTMVTISAIAMTVSPAARLSKLDSCHSLSPFQILGPMVQWMATEIIWLIRIKALYGDKKKGIMVFWSICASLNMMKFAMISTMAIHAVFLALILYKFQQHMDIRNVGIKTIMSAFIADGIVYYIGLAFAVIFEIVTTSGGPSVLPIVNLSL